MMNSESREEQRSITELKDRHRGEDIWVIASGATMNLVKPEFFENKITVGVNRVCKKFKCDYVIGKDAAGFHEILEFSGAAKIVLSKHEQGALAEPLNRIPGAHWIFDHLDNEESPDHSVIGSDMLVVSYSTITSAVHFSAYLGASSVIICGHDCCVIDGQPNIDGYYDKTPRYQASEVEYVSFLQSLGGHTETLAKKLHDHYGVHIHSLNPFVNAISLADSIKRSEAKPTLPQSIMRLKRKLFS